MKKVILLLCTVILLVSCHGQRNVKAFASGRAEAKTNIASCQPVSLKSLIRQFRFDPSAIYGDVFGNKAWH